MINDIEEPFFLCVLSRLVEQNTTDLVSHDDHVPSRIKHIRIYAKRNIKKKKNGGGATK